MRVFNEARWGINPGLGLGGLGVWGGGLLTPRSNVHVQYVKSFFFLYLFNLSLTIFHYAKRN